MKVGYDPKRSKVSDDKLAEFIRSAITGDITEVSRVRQKIVLRGGNCNRRVFLWNMAFRVIPGMLSGGGESYEIYQTEPNGTKRNQSTVEKVLNFVLIKAIHEDLAFSCMLLLLVITLATRPR